jgi:opacity protein-like surface antigen
MRSVTRAFALLGGLALSGLITFQTAQAADIEPVVEEPGLQWYVSVFGGPKWGDGDVKAEWTRESDPCYESLLICELFVPFIRHDGELHGEVDNGFLIGGALGAQFTENFRGEIEVSGARLDTETRAEEYVSYGPVLGSNYTTKDDDHLSELFIMANVWFGFPVSSMFSPYVGGGVGVAHVDADFGVGEFSTGQQQIDTFAASIDADSWNFAYQLGAGILIGLSDHFAIDLGYRFKAIPNVDLDDPKFCGGKDCYPPVVDFKADDDFDIHEHVAQIGLTIGF